MSVPDLIGEYCPYSTFANFMGQFHMLAQNDDWDKFYIATDSFKQSKVENLSLRNIVEDLAKRFKDNK